MTQSESIAQLAAALCLAQAAIKGASKDSVNPHFQSSYADLASVWDAIREPLTANGLSVVQLPSAEGQKVTVTTILLHKSGEFVSGELTVSADKSTAQAVGSVITYLRRYALAAITGVAPEDDDGEGAAGRGSDAGKEQPRQQAKPKPALISEAQQARILGLMDIAGKTQAAVVEILKRHGFKNRASITVDKYDAIIDEICPKELRLDDPK